MPDCRRGKKRPRPAAGGGGGSSVGSGGDFVTVTLLAYLEELHRTAGRPWPPPNGPKAFPLRDGSEAQAPTGDAYLLLRATHDSACDAPFFSIPLPDGGVCIADYGKHAVRFLSAAGKPLLALGSGGDPQAAAAALTHPLGMALVSTGTLYVADESGRVLQLDEAGRCLRTFSAHSPGGEVQDRPMEAWLPHGGAARAARAPPRQLQPGELSESNPIMEHTTLPSAPPPPAASLSSPSPAGSQAARGLADAEGAFLPSGVALGPGGRLYLSDRRHDRVVCLGTLSAHGGALSSAHDGAQGSAFAFGFGARGSGPAELHDPRGLAVHAGQVWVADMCNHRISVFSLRGRPLRQFGRFGAAPGEFRHPVGVALVSDLLLVSEYSGGRVQVLTPEGGPLQVIGPSAFGGTCLGAIGADARRATVCDTAGRVHLFDIVRRGAHPVTEPRTLHTSHFTLHTPSEGGQNDEAHPDEAPPQDESAVLSAAARAATLRRTRAGRVCLAVEAADYAGVLAALTRDDVAALVPEALAHAAAHPAQYQLPPCRPADALVAEFEQHLAGRAPPLGPPHW